MLLKWHIAPTTIAGLSGGLVALWDPQWVKIKAFKFFVGILLEGNIRRLGGRIHTLNIYAPYRERTVF